MLLNHHHVTVKTSIVTTFMGIPNEYKNKCIKELYKLGDYYKKETNVKAIMTSYNIFSQTKVFNVLIQKIMDRVTSSFPLKDDRFEYGLKDCWGAIYKKGDFTLPHYHLPCILSFVYYLQLPLQSSSLIFPQTNYDNPIEEDMLIIFPAYMEHEVPPHKSDEDRICLAGNVVWKYKKPK